MLLSNHGKKFTDLLIFQCWYLVLVDRNATAMLSNSVHFCQHTPVIQASESGRGPLVLASMSFLSCIGESMLRTKRKLCTAFLPLSSSSHLKTAGVLACILISNNCIETAQNHCLTVFKCFAKRANCKFLS